MRTNRSIAALLLTAALPLAACSNGDDAGEARTEPAKTSSPAPSTSVDCTDQSLDQAEWMEHCADQPGTGGDGQPASLEFGKTYSWPDGLKVSITEARIFTDWSEYEEPDPSMYEFRLKLKVTNASKTPVNLDELSTVVEGATNGGEAYGTEYENDAAPLSGRLAPGITTVKTEDGALEKKYGKNIVVTVQRVTEDFETDYEFPEFTGTITE
ncbi:hypothetical protein [Streptomyces barkulensis]|uniref:hypothetical protein n=1 Tax=Streptomyces barkulensis TaxID=1257026 RepID=UPI00117CEABF|nr:hypothetical protein [Streptomyces barkulensis]